MTAFVTITDADGTCPRCGAGKGRPHYERCLVPAPAYDRPLSQHEVTGLTAYAIGIFPLDVVRRSTIRAMLPRGYRKPKPPSATRRPGADNKVNTTSADFHKALAWLAKMGWIERREDCVIVVARDPLVRFSCRRLSEVSDLAEGLRASLAAVAAGLPEEILPAARRQREAELDAIRRLMEQSPATGPHSGRGYARLTHKPGLLP